MSKASAIRLWAEGFDGGSDELTPNDVAVEYFNTSEAEIDADGEIWLPGRGWALERELELFWDWLADNDYR